MRVSLLAVGVHVALVSAIPWIGPSVTEPVLVPQALPIPTAAPQWSFRALQLLRRDTTTDPGICGWIEGFSQNPYSCVDSSTCLWDTANSVIGCGFPTSIAFQTACVGYYDLSASCDLSCSFNPSINRCPSTIPYCVNITLGGEYTAFACGASKYTSYPAVELTFTGETTLNYLPRFVEAGGSVSYGTQTPSGYSSGNDNPPTSSSSEPTTTSSPTSSNPTSSANPTSSSLTDTAAPQAPSISPTQQPENSSGGSSSNTGAIAGGVVGGVAGVAAVAGLAIYFILRSRRRQRETALAANAEVAGALDQKPPFQPQPGYPPNQPFSPQAPYGQPQYGQPGYPPQGYPQQPQFLTELPGGAASNELPAEQSQFPHQSAHELQ